MNIAVLAAMPQEYRAVCRSLGAAEAGRCGEYLSGRFRVAEHEIMVVKSGIGFDNAARATETVCAGFQPDLLISAGFCGGVTESLRVGDVVVARQFLIAGRNDVIESVPVSVSLAGSRFAGAQSEDGRQVFEGTFVSTPTVTSKKHIAGLLPSDAHPAVVEMESAAIAIVAAENGIPLCAVRTVSDPADEELAFSMDEFCDTAMNIRPGKVLLTLLHRPVIIPQLIRLAGNSRTAAASLATAIELLLPLVWDAPGC
ncbi:MAG: hypothetical protein WCP10_09055 [Desulfuromonadales bacterium]